MLSKNNLIKKHIITYGFLFGILNITFSFLTYITGNYTKPGLFHFIVLLSITIICIITGLIFFKKNNNNYISLKEALIIGISISLIGGIMLTTWEISLIKLIDPEIITQLENNQIKKVAESSPNFTQEEIERKIAITRKNTSAISWFILALTEDLIVGFILSLIGGLIIRKKRDPFK